MEISDAIERKNIVQHFEIIRMNEKDKNKNRKNYFQNLRGEKIQTENFSYCTFMCTVLNVCYILRRMWRNILISNKIL